MFDINNALISSIVLGDYSNIRTLTNRRNDITEQLGTPIIGVTIDRNINNNDELLELLSLAQIDSCLNINMETLRNPVIYEFLHHLVANNRQIVILRIMDENYTLTQEDYDLIAQLDPYSVYVDDYDDNIEQTGPFLHAQHGLYKYTTSDEDTGRRTDNYIERDSAQVYHFTRNITDIEIGLLNSSHFIEWDSNPIIEINIHNPSEYMNVLSQLEKINGIERARIRFIGYPLDKSEDQYWEALSQSRLANNIDILFSTCHDLVVMYTQEPFCGRKELYSELEDSGLQSLNNYRTMLRSIDEVSKLIQDNNFSPLESAICAKRYLDKNFIYDDDYRENDQMANINIGDIFIHGNGEKMRAICLGFASLYSVMLRRNGIKCFRYGADQHERNVISIKDPKYNVDTVATVDTTFDLSSSHSNNLTYDNFLLSPEKAASVYNDFFTIPDSLIARPESRNSLAIDYPDPYSAFFHPLRPSVIGYDYRMLELMEYARDDDNNTEQYYQDVLIDMYRNGVFSQIDEEKLRSAAKYVEERMGSEFTPEQVDVALDSRADVIANNNDPTCTSIYSHNTYSIVNDILNDEYVRNYVSGSTITNNNQQQEVEEEVEETNTEEESITQEEEVVVNNPIQEEQLVVEEIGAETQEEAEIIDTTEPEEEPVIEIDTEAPIIDEIQPEEEIQEEQQEVEQPVEVVNTTTEEQVNTNNTEDNSLSELTDEQIQEELDELWRTVVSSGDEASEDEITRMYNLVNEQDRRTNNNIEQISNEIEEQTEEREEIVEEVTPSEEEVNRVVESRPSIISVTQTEETNDQQNIIDDDLLEEYRYYLRSVIPANVYTDDLVYRNFDVNEIGYQLDENEKDDILEYRERLNSR
ncbi:MAG: transglutaminase-like domain-containing protein [Bacilli bacterium]|nr:transglutaminase-like domain-containing protein [Bacilli bacterium]